MPLIYFIPIRTASGAIVYVADTSINQTPLLLTSGASVTSSFTTDESKNNFEVGYVGTPAPLNFSPNNANWSTYFNAVANTTISYGSSASFAFGTGDFTVEAWIYMTAYDFTVFNVGSAANGSYSIYVLGSGKFQSARYGDTAGAGTTTNVLSLNTWYHIAAVRRSGTAKIYVNGVEDTGATYSMGSITATAAETGRVWQLTTSAMSGYISNLRVVTGTAVYTANFTPATTPLTAVAGTSVLTAQDNRFINKGTGAAVTLTGTPTISNFSPFTTNTIFTPSTYSTYFNGTSDYLSIPANVAFNFTGDHTIEAFIYWDGTYSATGRIICATGGASSADQFGIFSSGGIYYASINSNAFPPANAWSHVAVSRQGSTVRFFINGVLVATGTNANNIGSSTAVMYVGVRVDGNHPWFGYISNLRIVKGTAVYTANFTPATSSLSSISGTSLLTCQNSTIVDNSTNAFALTATGTPSPRVVNPFGFTTAMESGTYTASTSTTPLSYSNKFNGTTDYLTVPSNSALAFGTGSGTVEFWLYPTSTSGFARVVTSTNGGFAAGAFMIRFNNGTFLAGDSGTATISSSTLPTLNVWNHIAWVGTNGTSQTLYINGVSVGTAGSYNITTPIQYIGGYYTVGPAEFYSGYISNLRILKGTALYASAFTPSSNAALTSISGTSLLTCQSSTFVDKSSNAFALTTTGTPTIETVNPIGFTGSGSITNTRGAAYFNGTTDYISVPASIDLQFGTGDFTLECWIWIASPSDSPIYEGRSTGTSSTGFTLTAFSSSVIRVYTGAGALISSSSTVYVNSWTHIAVVRKSGTTALYINGVSVGTSSSAMTLSDNAALISAGRYTGTSATTINKFFPGYISNFRIVKGTAVYTTNFVPPTAPLTAVSGTSLLTLQNNKPNNTSGFVNSVVGTSNLPITKTGNARTGSPNPYSFNYSNYFNGSTDALSGTLATGGLGSGNFTIETWIYQTVTLVNTNILDTRGTNGSATGLSVQIDTSNRPILYTSSTIFTSTRTITPYTWTHVAFVRNAGVITCYINGVASGAVSASTNYSDTGLVIGGNQPRNNWFTGYISNLRIVVGYAVYTPDFTPSTSPLEVISGTRLLTCQSARFVDNSPSRIALTVVSGTQVQPFNPFTMRAPSTPVSYGTYFGGSGNYLALTNSSAFKFGASTNPFSVELWVNIPASVGADVALIGNYKSTSYPANTDGWDILLNNASTAISFRWGYPNYADAGTGGGITYGTWNHVAVCRNSSGVMSMYVNGARTFTTSTNTSITDSTASNFWVGWAGSLSGATINPLTGHLSNVRILKGSTAYDPTQTTITVPTSQLTAITNTSLLTCQSSTLIDNSSNAFALTLTGTPTVTPSNPFKSGTLATPIFYSNYFDSTSRLTVPSSSAFDWTGDATIECWIRVNTLDGGTTVYGICGNTDGTSDQKSFFYVYGNGKLGFGKNGLNEITSTATGVITAGTWYHVAVVRSGSTTTLYVNGTSVGSGTTAVWSSGTSLFYITYAGNFRGYISNLRVVKGTALYTANFTPATSSLPRLTNTSLLTCQSSTLIDNSTNNFTLTATGTPGVMSTNPFVVGEQLTPNTYSTYFDGSGDYLTLPSSAAFALGTSYTIELWHYRTGTASTGSYTSVMQLVNTHPYGSPLSGFMLTYDGGSVFNFRDSAGSIILSYSSTNLALNTWYHVAIVRNGSGTNNTTMYINGASVVTGTSSGTQATAVPVYIGGDSNGNCSFPGYISNFRIVKGTAVYTANFTPATSSLTSITNTSLLTCQNSTFVDNSTNAFAITTTGAPTTSTVNPFGSTASLPSVTASSSTGYVASTYEGSIFLDGTGDYLTLASPPEYLRNWWLHTAFTIEAWVYVNTLTQDATNAASPMIGHMSPTTTGNFWSFGPITNGTVKFTYYNGSLLNFVTTTAIGTRQWHHLAFVKNGTGLTIYINGVSSATATVTGTPQSSSTTPITVGSHNSTAFNGYITDLRISSTALYTTNFVPTTAPLATASTTLLLLNPSTHAITDSTAINTLETVGSVRVSTSTVKNGNYSLYFDGTSGYCTLPYTTALNIPKDFTIEAWVYPIARLTSFPCIINNYSTYAANGGFSIFAGHNTSGSTKYNVYFNGANIINSTPVITYNKWVHLAVVRSGTTITLYVDGVSAGTSASQTATLVGTSNSWWIGTAGDLASTGYFNGYISDLRVTRAARYTTTFTPPTTSLLT